MRNFHLKLKQLNKKFKIMKIIKEICNKIMKQLNNGRKNIKNKKKKIVNLKIN